MPIDPRMIAAPSSPAAPPASAAALNNLYVGLLDLNRRVDSLASARTVIDAASLDGTQLKPDSVTASHIVAGSIHASEIEVGNIVASIMTVGAVNASHIDAASIRASVLDATVLTATNAFITSLRASILDAGVLTATNATIGTLRASIINGTQIVAQNLQAQVLTAVNAAITDLSSFNVSTGTLTANLLRTAASGARVEIGTIAGGIKGYNASGTMTFGFDYTTGTATVGAIAVTGANGTQVPASTLTGFVGGGNLLKDSSFESTDPATPGSLWSASGVTQSKQTTQAFHGTNSLRLVWSSGTDAYTWTDTSGAHGVPLTSLRSRPVVASVWVYITGTDNGTPTVDRSLYIQDGVGNSTAVISTIPKNTWTRLVVKHTVAAGATLVQVRLYNPYNSGLNTVYYDGVQLEFGDAATAYNPKADEIIYGSITAVELAAGAVTASKINVSQLSAIAADMGTITAGTITGATFQTAAPGSARVAFNSTGFFVETASAVKQIQVTAGGGLTLLAGTTSGPPNQQRIQWLNGTGVVTGQLMALDVSTASISTVQLQTIAAATGYTAQTELRSQAFGGSSVAAIDVAANDVASGTATQVVVSAGGSNRVVLNQDGISGFLFNNVSILSTYQNGWTTQGGRQALHYWKDGAMVHIRGALSASAATSQVCMTLPAGYRPSNMASQPLVYWDAPAGVYRGGEVAVDTAGLVNIWNNTSVFSTVMTYVMVNVSFRTDR